MLCTPELREIRVFLTLAEELHYGRTAERLMLTPSRVSQIIRTLEARVGGRLFERTSRRVALTPLGARFTSSLKPAYEQLERAFRDTCEAATGICGTLRVGSYAALNLGPHWVRIVDQFEARHPDCRVEFIDTGAQRSYLEMLRSGELDMVASRLPLVQPDISIGPILSREERVLIIAKGDPLASRSAVSIEDFADRPVVGRAAGVPIEMVDAFVPPVTPSGKRLQRVPPRSFEEARLRVARGELVHATVRSAVEHLAHPDTTFRPISDLPPSQTALVWLTDTRSDRIHAFVRAAADVLGQTELAAHQPMTGVDGVPHGRESRTRLASPIAR